MTVMTMTMNDDNDDDDHRVEQCLPPHGDVEGDVQVGLVTARVEFHVPNHKMVN